MARKTNMQTIAVRDNNTGQTKTPATKGATVGVAGLGTNFRSGKAPRRTKTAAQSPPKYELGSRYSPFAAMLADPVNGPSALPPVALPSRAVAFKTYQEVLLTTDASGACALSVSPRMASQYYYGTVTGNSVTAYGAGQNNLEYTSFNTNYFMYVPLVMEVRLKFTGSMNAVAGRMYGIVSPNAAAGSGLLDLTTFPMEPNGCEAITADGISCTWYSTSSIWNNPTLAASTSSGDGVSDVQVVVGMLGGPASTSNIVTAGIYLHLAAIPKYGVCGIVPSDPIPDPHAAAVAGLMSSATTGHAASALSLKDRDQSRKKLKGHIRDVLKIGGQVIGAVAPHLSPAVTAAEALSMLLL